MSDHEKVQHPLRLVKTNLSGTQFSTLKVLKNTCRKKKTKSCLNEAVNLKLYDACQMQMNV
jgi:hypothetical protein